MHKVKNELIEEREEEFRVLAKAFLELHEALDERMRELQTLYDKHVNKTIKQVDICMDQLDKLVGGLTDV